MPGILKHPSFRIAVPLVIAVIVVFALHRFASHATWNDVKAGGFEIPLPGGPGFAMDALLADGVQPRIINCFHWVQRPFRA